MADSPTDGAGCASTPPPDASTRMDSDAALPPETVLTPAYPTIDELSYGIGDKPKRSYASAAKERTKAAPSSGKYFSLYCYVPSNITPADVVKAIQAVAPKVLQAILFIIPVEKNGVVTPWHHIVLGNLDAFVALSCTLVTPKSTTVRFLSCPAFPARARETAVLPVRLYGVQPCTTTDTLKEVISEVSKSSGRIDYGYVRIDGKATHIKDGTALVFIEPPTKALPIVVKAKDGVSYKVTLRKKEAMRAAAKNPAVKAYLDAHANGKTATKIVAQDAQKVAAATAQEAAAAAKEVVVEQATAAGASEATQESAPQVTAAASTEGDAAMGEPAEQQDDATQAAITIASEKPVNEESSATPTITGNNSTHVQSAELGKSSVDEDGDAVMSSDDEQDDLAAIANKLACDEMLVDDPYPGMMSEASLMPGSPVRQPEESRKRSRAQAGKASTPPAKTPKKTKSKSKKAKDQRDAAYAQEQLALMEERNGGGAANGRRSSTGSSSGSC